MATDSVSILPVWNIAGGPGRTGLYPAGVRLDRTPKRRIETRGAVQASVVFDRDDRAFAADMAGNIQAFATEGNVLWQRELAGPVSASPAVDCDQGIVFAGTHKGQVYGLRADNGEVLWARELPTKSDARILSDLLYEPARQWVVLSSWGGQYHGLDAQSGRTKQSWDAGLWPQAAATADAKGNIYCLRAVRGKGVDFLRVPVEGNEAVLYSAPETKRGAQRMITAAAPIVDQRRDTVYFLVNGDRRAELHAWSLKENRLCWSCSLASSVVATPGVSANGCVLLAGLDGSVHAVSPSGAATFHYSSGTDYLLSGPVSDADEHSYLGDPVGRVHRLDASGNGQEIFEATRAIQARPAFDRHGNLYVPSTDRTIYVFENRANS